MGLLTIGVFSQLEEGSHSNK